MFLLNLNLPKRLLLYFLFSIIWSLLFTLLMGITGYMLGFWQDCAINAGVMMVVICLLFEVYRIIVLKKVKTIRTEIAQTNTIIYDGASNYLAEMPKVLKGWLFLTEKKLIFRGISKKTNWNINISINSIQRIEKKKLLFNIYINDVLCFQVNKKCYDLISSFNKR